MSRARRDGSGQAPWGLKLVLLHQSQKRSFQKSDGTIFLTRYARDTVLADLDSRPGQVAIIPHGVEERFFREPLELSGPFSQVRPFRLLYVSIVTLYKHQWQVAEAVAVLRAQGVPVQLDFIGPCYPPAGRRLSEAITRLDPKGEFLHYRGALPFEQLHDSYRSADAFVFASSCENLPNILLEAMAAGLPIACSDRGPMPEVLADSGVYFDPERPEQIAEALMRPYRDDALRARLAQQAFRMAQSFSWERCARESFSFIAQVASGAKP